MTWDDHKKNFARLARDGGYTIAQYAAEFNLNPNTARRYLRAFKEDTRTADSRKPNKPVRKPLKSMIIDHSNDQHAGDHIAAEIAEKQRVNAVVSAAVENAKRQNKRINDRSDDHDVINRAHRTLRDRLERDTLDDDGERFEFEAGDYLIDNVEARKAARYVASVRGRCSGNHSSGKVSFSSPYAGERQGYVYSPGAGNARSAKRR